MTQDAPDPGTLYEREEVEFLVQRVHVSTRTVILVQLSGGGRPREVKWAELEARGYRRIPPSQPRPW